MTKFQIRNYYPKNGDNNIIHCTSIEQACDSQLDNLVFLAGVLPLK